MDSQPSSYQRRYPALSLTFEYEAAKCSRLAFMIGATYVMLPTGALALRSPHDKDGNRTDEPLNSAHWIWRLRQEAVQRYPFPPEFEHLDKWLNEPEPQPTTTARI